LAVKLRAKKRSEIVPHPPQNNKDSVLIQEGFSAFQATTSWRKRAALQRIAS